MTIFQGNGRGFVWWVELFISHKLPYTRCATESRMIGKAKCFLVRKAVFQAITGYRLDVHSQTCGYK
jgi:hypothetical protein